TGDTVATVNSVNAVVIDAEGLGETAADACARMREARPGVPILMVGTSTVDAAVRALRAGAADYLDHTSPPEEFAAALDRIRLDQSIVRWKAQETREPDRYPELWGESTAMIALRDRIDQAAASDATVVVTGETGAG